MQYQRLTGDRTVNNWVDSPHDLLVVVYDIYSPHSTTPTSTDTDTDSPDTPIHPYVRYARRPREYDHVVSAETVNNFKNRLDIFWSNQDVLHDYRADLHGIRNRTIVM